MKKSPDPSQPNSESLESADAERLEFPIEPDFISYPPRIELQAMLRRIEENMPWRNSRPGEAERRLAETIPEEFVL
jgi:hypothetical protein